MTALADKLQTLIWLRQVVAYSRYGDTPECWTAHTRAQDRFIQLAEELVDQHGEELMGVLMGVRNGP